MSTAAPVPARQTRRFEGMSDFKLIASQTRFEQLSFWLNPVGAFFTVGFSTIFLIILGSSSGHSNVSFLHIRLIQYYVAGFIAYGVMSSCYNILAITMVNRREFGLLKRLRLSPAPTWILMAAIFISTMIISVLQIVIMLVVGRFGYSVHGPADLAPFLIALIVGMLSFTAMGMAMSTLIPNADAAGPATSVVFFILLALSGLWFPISNGSGLAKVTSYFPVRPLIEAVDASFNHIPGTGAWAWHDILVVAIWGVAGVIIALRRWQWAPRRMS
jgi:ABC-2 type transport system permease protein